MDKEQWAPQNQWLFFGVIACPWTFGTPEHCPSATYALCACLTKLCITIRSGRKDLEKKCVIFNKRMKQGRNQ